MVLNAANVVYDAMNIQISAQNILEVGIDLDIAWLCVSCGRASAQIASPFPVCWAHAGQLEPVARVISDAADPHRLVDLLKIWPNKQGGTHPSSRRSLGILAMFSAFLLIIQTIVINS